jgi:hypothetical protein
MRRLLVIGLILFVVALLVLFDLYRQFKSKSKSIPFSYRSPVFDSLEELNVRVHRLIQKNPRCVYGGDLPGWIVDRVNRSAAYSLGFTGFKGSKLDAGLSGQFLIAVHSDKRWVHGGPDPSPRYYAVTVPDGKPVRYRPGGSFEVPPLEARRNIIHYSDERLLRLFGDSVRQLCDFVIEQEQDRKPEGAE